MPSSENTDKMWSLDPAQVARVMNCLDSPLREIVELAALTGMRLVDILQLRRDQVVFLDEFIVLPTTGHRLLVVANPRVQQILRTQLESHTNEWVFPDPRLEESAKNRV